MSSYIPTGAPYRRSAPPVQPQKIFPSNSNENESSCGFVCTIQTGWLEQQPNSQQLLQDIERQIRHPLNKYMLKSVTMGSLLFSVIVIGVDVFIALQGKSEEPSSYKHEKMGFKRAYYVDDKYLTTEQLTALNIRRVELVQDAIRFNNLNFLEKMSELLQGNIIIFSIIFFVIAVSTLLFLYPDIQRQNIEKQILPLWRKLAAKAASEKQIKKIFKLLVKIHPLLKEEIFLNLFISFPHNAYENSKLLYLFDMTCAFKNHNLKEYIIKLIIEKQKTINKISSSIEPDNFVTAIKIALIYKNILINKNPLLTEDQFSIIFDYVLCSFSLIDFSVPFNKLKKLLPENMNYDAMLEKLSQFTANNIEDFKFGCYFFIPSDDKKSLFAVDKDYFLKYFCNLFVKTNPEIDSLYKFKITNSDFEWVENLSLPNSLSSSLFIHFLYNLYMKSELNRDFLFKKWFYTHQEFYSIMMHATKNARCTDVKLVDPEKQHQLTKFIYPLFFVTGESNDSSLPNLQPKIINDILNQFKDSVSADLTKSYLFLTFGLLIAAICSSRFLGKEGESPNVLRLLAVLFLQEAEKYQPQNRGFTKSWQTKLLSTSKNAQESCAGITSGEIFKWFKGQNNPAAFKILKSVIPKVWWSGHELNF